MSFYLGEDLVSLDDVLGEIRSSFVKEDIAELKNRLNEDGYLCLRNFIPQKNVIAARKIIYENLKENGSFSNSSTFEYPISEKGTFFLGGKKEITHHPDFLGMVEHPSCFNFFSRLFDEPARTYDYKWVRTVGEHVAGTQAHMDVVYMGRGSKKLHSMWIPIGEVSRDNGPMVVLDKSHNHSNLQKIRDTYGKMDVDRDLIKGGWFTNNYTELSEMTKTNWLLGDYNPGDVVIINIYTFHGSLRNELNKVRFTCDVRFQPASDVIDNRWIGENPLAHEKGRSIEIEKARESWGV